MESYQWLSYRSRNLLCVANHVGHDLAGCLDRFTMVLTTSHEDFIEGSVINLEAIISALGNRLLQIQYCFD